MDSSWREKDKRAGVRLAFAFLLGFVAGAAACAFWVTAAMHGRMEQQAEIGAKIIHELRGHADNPKLTPDNYGDER